MSPGVTIVPGMVRWEPNASDRLVEAALELFAERGFEETTVEEIARRAGLTKRTFFRHFADKREVLFGGGEAFSELFAGGVAAAPAPAPPLQAVACGFDAVVPLFEDRREAVRRRQAVIAANRELQERELVKLASLARAVAAVLRERGVAEPEASVAAEAGVAAFRVGFEAWLAEGCEEGLGPALRRALKALQGIAAAGGPAGPTGRRGRRAA